MTKITSGEEFTKKLLEKIEEHRKINIEVEKNIKIIEKELNRFIDNIDNIPTIRWEVKITLKEVCSPDVFKKIQDLYMKAGWSNIFFVDSVQMGMNITSPYIIMQLPI